MSMSEKDFDAFVDSIQEKVFDEAQHAYGPKGFERWRNPKFCGKLADETCHGRMTGKCGDTIEMSLKIDNNQIVDGAYTTTGCASSSICSSFAVELALGRNVEEIFELDGEDVLAFIGKFPEDDSHCAFLAVNAIQDAVNNYLVERTKKEQAAK
ncbi:MAG: iron-sulfur cluster assembly scaffold protein [Deltaproteobacteria bacterium]|nr:MAG: iron-sulfur cluster assembly scaffold protein [Deltaproteobacteria bacterium]